MTTSVAATPRYFINSWSARTGQRIAARCIDSAIAGCVVLFVLLIGPHGRPLAQDLQIVAVITAIECGSLRNWGATIGMRANRIRVATIGRAGNPTLVTAFRRTIPVAWCYALPIPGMFAAFVLPWALVVSVALSPHRRGFHDRLSGTLVVQGDAPPSISPSDLETWWDSGSEVVMSPWGRVPDLFARRRARAHRLDGIWWLAGLIGCIAVASVGMTDVPLLWLWLTVVWMFVATIDETHWLSEAGTTPGHAAFGFKVVDIATGRPPSRGRALLRSAVLAPFLYLPPLQLVLGLWVHASSLHRGPHDLAARTIVVEPGYVAPSFVTAPRVPMIPGPF